MKKLSSFLCMVLCSIALHANVVSGTCGDNLTWSYDTETQALTIEGTGDMTNYVSEDYWEPGGEQTFTVAPWYSVRSNITSLTLPDGLTSIGTYAFYKCTNLTSVTIPNTVTCIWDYAFSNCPLNTISIPNSVTTIGSGAFYDNIAVNSVTIGNGISEIGYAAFGAESSWWLQEFNQLTKTIYTGDLAGWCAIRFAGDYANPAARSKNLYINDELVTDVAIPSNVTKIGDYAFCNNMSLHTITIPNGVDSIGAAAFYGCEWITKLALPESLKSIGNSAFYGCYIDSVTIPSQIKTIESYAFSYCPVLRYVNIPEGVTTINSDAFWNSNNLTSITIPSTVTEIGNNAFNRCLQVYLKGTVPPTITDETFNSEASIAVPCSAMSAYNAADVWQYMNLYGLSYPLDLSATEGGYARILFSDCDNSTITINAIANNNYEYKFSQWSDGNTDNPRTLTLTEDTTLTAEFTAVPYHKVELKGYSLDGSYQHVNDEGTDIDEEWFRGNKTISVLDGLQVTISESGSCGNWLGWSDGNMEKSNRVITITSDTVIESLFDAESYNVSITAGWGGYLDDGNFEGKIYECDNYIRREAYPNDGYYFVGWSNGETDTYLRLNVYSDTTVVARFAEIVPATVVAAPTAACASMGTVTGGGAYNTGDYVTITAVPNEGYHFVEWSDGNGIPERTFRLISDTTLYATFAAGDFGGKCGKNLFWNWYNGRLVITGTGAMDLKNYPAWKLYSDMQITSLSLPEGITTISAEAFYRQPLTTVILPASVEWVGSDAFANNDKLLHFEYQGNNIKAEGSSLYGCRNLQYFRGNIDLGGYHYVDTLIISNGRAGEGLEGIRYIDLTNADNTSTEGFFFTAYHEGEGIPATRTLYLPTVLTEIMDLAFVDLRYLKEITIPAGVTYIGAGAFEDCRSIESVVFAGNNVKTIGDWAFYNCHNLRNITLPEGVEELGTAAFYECTHLNELTIPSTMKKIADNGFAGCERMQTMYVNALVPPTIEAKTFEDVDRATPVFVPRGTMERYQADQYWSEFFNMAEYDAPTGNLNASTNEANGLRKVVRDGQVLIIRGDEVYTVLGEKIQ
ncbi:MAG: leucine-rich repeat protein [Paludibacteraceae bacterium]